jgi:hypothetical protein
MTMLAEITTTGNNEDADRGQDNDQVDNDGDVGEDGTNADSEDKEENEEVEVNSDEDDANADASYQEAEDMDQLADSQLTFVSLAGDLPPSQVYAGLIANVSRPASNVLYSPVATSAIQDDVLRICLLTLENISKTNKLGMKETKRGE